MTDPYVLVVQQADDTTLQLMRDTLEEQQQRLEGAGQATSGTYAGTLQALIIVIDEQRKRALRAPAACPECEMVHAPGLGRTCDEWRAIREPGSRSSASDPGAYRGLSEGSNGRER